jgi:hypothetical protein
MGEQMKAIRVAFVSVLFVGLVGCGFLDSQLARDPVTGKSKLEQEVDVAKPAIPTPWGEIAAGAALLFTSVYGAFHAREANKQTDKPEPPKV